MILNCHLLSSAANMKIPRFRMLAATEVAELSPVKPIVTQTEDFGRKFGQIGQFLAKGGYGWILEQDEMPKSDVPLMTELDIEPNEIWYKIRCVLLPLPQVRKIHKNFMLMT